MTRCEYTNLIEEAVAEIANEASKELNVSFQVCYTDGYNAENYRKIESIVSRIATEKNINKQSIKQIITRNDGRE